MAIATITIEDAAAHDTANDLQMEVNFGVDGFDERSRAHQMIDAMHRSALRFFEANGLVRDTRHEYVGDAPAAGDGHGI